MLSINSLVEILTRLQPAYYLFEYSPVYAIIYSTTYTVFYTAAICQVDNVVIPMYPGSLDTLYLLSISLHNQCYG
ncbi:hypothetical protein CN425_18735 [Bacillus cereus]|uniref:Uncharacterized protein n=1 Tax=Bacillus cereus TaxID=1396 RepID=A0A2A8PT46_BACCE|nr:hypothetical protein CN425_18735 [Bacillus cereus]